MLLINNEEFNCKWISLHKNFLINNISIYLYDIKNNISNLLSLINTNISIGINNYTIYDNFYVLNVIYDDKINNIIIIGGNTNNGNTN